MAPGVGGYRQINKALNICAFDDYLETQQTRLPKLLEIEQISPRVIRILGCNPGKFTLQGTNTYIIGTGTNRLLIDTGQGIPEWTDLISDTLSKENISLSHVLLTHWHGDHTGGVPDLIRMYPELNQSIFKHTPSKAQQPIKDGQIFKVEGARVRAVHAPGHSHDHMCFVLEEEEAMFTGDNILGHGTAAVEHLSTWIRTLRTMQSHNCVKGYPAHGVVIADLKGKIAGELAGKLRREQRALEALQQARTVDSGGGKGKVTVKELVTAVHGDHLDATVRQMALEPFMDEILRKLAEDNVVGFQVRSGVKRWFALV
ncbi:hypothetical protein N7491_008380 [Penicillium cf. griseofulvum]|uniref:Metallo-beta-lactamase domain-containing protein n=1 Tax=Penicillium cf. griseofulvum TaxID=2972120 RepID=A0A9W9MGE1_9EURO|nr:hypothetical protein N7472_006019 [Penicillium cf. griseofulvum]KAJ5423164.1 hypothetical protein N7491_008380 [Penicillium cf. griseofulvum]KAJ5431570.1 hypothetical protein N7445_009302 [Penicillium cf. griseofulvum]